MWYLSPRGPHVWCFLYLDPFLGRHALHCVYTPPRHPTSSCASQYVLKSALSSLASVSVVDVAARVGVEDPTTLRAAWAAAVPGDRTLRATTDALTHADAKMVEDTLAPLLVRLADVHSDIACVDEEGMSLLEEALQLKGVAVFRASGRRQGPGIPVASKFVVLRGQVDAARAVYCDAPAPQ